MLVLSFSNVSRLDSLVFLLRRRAYGERQKPPTWRFQKGCNVVFRGRSGTSWHSHVSDKVSKVVLCDKRNTFERASEGDLHFWWQVQHFGHVHGRFAWQAQHFRCVVLRVSCESQCQGCVKWWPWHGRRGTSWECCFRGRRSIWWRSVVCGVSFCVAGAVFIGQFRFVIAAFRIGTAARGAMLPSFVPFWLGRSDVETCHSRLDPPHSTFHTFHYYTDHFTFHSTFYTPHFTLHTPQFTVHTWHSTSAIHTSTLYNLHFTLHTLHFTLHTLDFTLYSWHSTLYTWNFTLHTLHSTYHTLHFTLYTWHSTLYTSHSTLYTPHFTLYTPHSTLYTLHSTLSTLTLCTS